VYKTKLATIELSDDFDEYVMVIEQVIKSGQPLLCLPASLPLTHSLFSGSAPLSPPLQAPMRCRQGRNAGSSATSSAEKP
jgi:hypothetical protein